MKLPALLGRNSFGCPWVGASLWHPNGSYLAEAPVALDRVHQVDFATEFVAEPVGVHTYSPLVLAKITALIQ